MSKRFTNKIMYNYITPHNVENIEQLCLNKLGKYEYVEQIIENPDMDNVIWYNTSFTGVLCEGWRMLTQEEYDLLKEVLLCK